ncbi:MAG: sulfatase-like hydrolase/transferase [bacterium]|nr:sulfatase-like hydrolase/transferase [bacterium]
MSTNRRVNQIGLAVGLAIAALALAAAFRGGGSDDSARAVVLGQVVRPGAASGFNVLLVTLDTTRPDHLGCYGASSAQTPAIDSLLEHGVRFDDAVTSVPTTLAAHTTILTGLYPPTTGVRDNGIHHLADSFDTLAEVLQRQGYRTGGFVSSFVLDRRFGLDQGFDVYDFSVAPDGRRGAASLEHERRAQRVTQPALDWIRAYGKAGGEAPFFAWVHYYDPHHPYDSPLGKTAAFRDRPYDAEIAFVDVQFERLLRTLDTLGLRENTLIVLVSDHGEGLFEHDEGLHGIFIYETTMRVALVLSNPRLFSAPFRVDDRVVGTVDIFPTIIDLLGLPTSPDTEGESLLEIAPQAERAIYIETVYPTSVGCAQLRGLRRHRDKYILAPRPEYYDLRKDPEETENLIDHAGAEPVALRQQLDELSRRWAETGGAGQAERVLTPAEQKQLEALGYVGSNRREDTANLPDPKDRIGVVNQMSDVVRLLATGQPEEALVLAREVAAQTEGWRMPTLMVAEALMQLGRDEERVDVLARYCEQTPTAEMLYYLAHALLEVRRYRECEDKLRAAELLDPQFGSVAALRGDLYFAQQRYAEAAGEYERALELDAQRLDDSVRDKLARARLQARENGG